jgi:hypothetical protein
MSSSAATASVVFCGERDAVREASCWWAAAAALTQVPCGAIDWCQRHSRLCLQPSGMKYLPRDSAYAKLEAMVAGTVIGGKERGG